MAGKSRRKRVKQAQRRKIETRQRTTAAAPVPITPQPNESAAPPEASSPPVTAPRQPASTQTIRHPYIGAELRTIGILAGIILITLIILYLTLS
ncbi:MAG TPA: hypothetical protein G4O10_08545 [Dehalococcoidia bacterium]|nr:hypothetical protein [Dehalococcoidia bacterium]